MRPTRPISWLKAARKEFQTFPDDAQDSMFRALSIAAEGGKADIAKPFKGVEGGVFEIALRHQGNAYRAIYAVQIGGGLVGGGRLSEEVQERDQDSASGCGSYQGKN